jgi:hypothetical protein
MKSLRVLLLAGLLTAASASAQVLLTVDVRNPAAVVISATGAFPNAENSAYTVWEGVMLKSFFTVGSPFSTLPAEPYTLRAAGATTPYSSFFSDNYSGPSIDLGIFGGVASTTEMQLFSTSAPAFTGAMTGDFSGRPLPAAGYIGNILIGYYNSGAATPGPFIGTYQVIPEPAHYGLIAGLAGLVSLLWLRRRRCARDLERHD